LTTETDAFVTFLGRLYQTSSLLRLFFAAVLMIPTGTDSQDGSNLLRETPVPGLSN
jgi:hypothetical protein